MSNEVTEVLMPLMGEGVTEAELVKWLKPSGSTIKKDEPLFEVSTDKVDTEIPSPCAGVLRNLFFEPGSKVGVNQVVALISTSADTPISDALIASLRSAAVPPKKSAPAGNPTRSVSMERPAAESSHHDGRPLRSSPVVKRMAREFNLNLAAVAGRGFAGRITKDDVMDFLAQVRSELNIDSSTPTGPTTSMIDGKEFLEGVQIRRERMSKMRELIAEHMTRSVRTSPHVTTTFEIDCHNMVAARSMHQEKFQKTHGFKLTYTHMLAYATLQTIKKHPIVNVSIDGTDILYKEDINLGIAVAIESGLIVPVVKKSNELSLSELSKRIQDLVNRARTKKLNPDDIQGGTFSITNPGLFGSLHSSPIINQPQVAILSVGALIDRPVVVAKEIKIHPLMQIGLTFDHRVIDGEIGAKFLADLKGFIESDWSVF